MLIQFGLENDAEKTKLLSVRSLSYEIFYEKPMKNKTRKHSNRMRTARMPTVLVLVAATRSALLVGGGGESIPGPRSWGGVETWATHP